MDTSDLTKHLIDSLPLLPLHMLQSNLARIRALTADTSGLLAHLLQQRDALQQDSQTYNKLIGELVGEAQKIKTGGKTRTGRGRTGSGMVWLDLIITYTQTFPVCNIIVRFILQYCALSNADTKQRNCVKGIPNMAHALYNTTIFSLMLHFSRGPSSFI